MEIFPGQRIFLAVLAVNTQGIVVVHPVHQEVVHFAPQQFDEAFRPGQHRGNHGVCPDAGFVQRIQRGDSVHNRGRMGFEQLPYDVVGGGNGEPDLEILRVFQNIDIPQHQRRTGLDDYRPIVFRQDCQAFSASIDI